MHRWLREPLLHFIVLGVIVFTLHRWLASAPANRIVVSASIINGLRQEHVRRSGAPPTAAEEAAAIQRFVDGEVFYREARALGLDRDDLIVRRRLTQKMELLTEDSEVIADPSDAVLQAYLDAHRDRYAQPARVSFGHVFIARDRHPSDFETVAARLREQLEAGADPATLGDPFLRGREFTRQSESDVAGIFGTEFAAQVMALPLDQWSAPVRSSFGVHLVRVREKVAAAAPTLELVRNAVQRDWLEEQRAAANRTALERLRKRYEIVIEHDAPPASDAAK